MAELRIDDLPQPEVEQVLDEPQMSAVQGGLTARTSRSLIDTSTGEISSLSSSTLLSNTVEPLDF